MQTDSLFFLAICGIFTMASTNRNPMRHQITYGTNRLFNSLLIFSNQSLTPVNLLKNKNPLMAKKTGTTKSVACCINNSPKYNQSGKFYIPIPNECLMTINTARIKDRFVILYLNPFIVSIQSFPICFKFMM